MPSDASRLKSALSRWGRSTLNDSLRDTVVDLRVAAPIGKVTPTSRRRPGELRRSIRAMRGAASSMSHFAARIVAPVIQAATTDKGARPHVIRARNAPMLRFWWENGPNGPGIYHFRKVNHPGNPPRPWFERTLRRSWPRHLRAAARRNRLR